MSLELGAGEAGSFLLWNVGVAVFSLQKYQAPCPQDLSQFGKPRVPQASWWPLGTRGSPQPKPPPQGHSVVPWSDSLLEPSVPAGPRPTLTASPAAGSRPLCPDAG